MQTKITYTKIFNIAVCLLLTVSMLMLSNIDIAGFPLYCLLLFIIVLGWLATGIIFFQQGGKTVWQIRYVSDLLAIAVLAFELLTIIVKLFQDPEKGDIGIINNVVIISIVFLYMLLSERYKFWDAWFDLILYSGLLVVGIFLLPYFIEIQELGLMEAVTQSSGKMASYLMLVGMVSIYQYCTCKDKLRSWFYLLIAGMDFLALFLNQNIISFWLMTIYFLAIPIMLRATASLIKKDMQMFALFAFMLSNMSLLTGYTDIIVKEVSFSLEHSVYLELLLAVGAILFFHYWDRIPEGIDLERLVMRKLRKGYQFLLKAIGIVFVGIILGGDRWASLPEMLGSDAVKGFAVPLVATVKQEESGFYGWFSQLGVLGSIVVIIFIVWLFGRMWRNYQLDKPCTGILILISTIFMVQLFFWNPSIQTYVVHFVLLMGAVFNKEERVRITSTKIIIEEQRSREDEKI